MGLIADFVAGAADGAVYSLKEQMKEASVRERDEANFIKQQELERIRNVYQSSENQASREFRSKELADSRSFSREERKAKQAFESKENDKKLSVLSRKEESSSLGDTYLKEDAELDKWYRKRYDEIDDKEGDGTYDPQTAAGLRERADEQYQSQKDKIIQRYGLGSKEKEASNDAVTFNGISIPKTHIAALKSDDKRYSEQAFDEKYGSGAAAFVLGKKQTEEQSKPVAKEVLTESKKPGIIESAKSSKVPKMTRDQMPYDDLLEQANGIIDALNTPNLSENQRVILSKKLGEVIREKRKRMGEG